MNLIESIKIKNFKSIKDVKIKLSKINIIIGPNGSGKSNFLSYFKFLNYISLSNIKNYFEREGGPENIFYFPAYKENDSITSEIIFYDEKKWRNVYAFEIEFSNKKNMYFKSEKIASWDKSTYDDFKLTQIGGNNSDSIFSFNKIDHKLDNVINSFNNILPKIKSIRYYHFHDVGVSSPLKSTNYIEGISQFLNPNGSNLAYVLHRIKQNNRDIYHKILLQIQAVAPFISDFILETETDNFTGEKMINLRWINRHFHDNFLHVSILSDGTLRFIALIVALLDPIDDNRTIIIDEPELGLHPYAIKTLADSIKLSSSSNQLILSTQSKELISCFEVEDIIVTNYSEGKTSFKRVDDFNDRDVMLIKNLLKDGETMADIWDSNLIGGNIKW